MNNYVLLKWGSLKGYNLTDDFIKEHKEVAERLANYWDKLYEHHCSATGASEELQKSNDLKIELVSILEKLFDLGVIFQNDWNGTYYNTFKEIKDYIMNYGG